MKPSESIRPISYLKAHAAEVIRDIAKNHKTIVITQNGIAKVIVQDVREYERTQETIALLKILAKSSQNIKKGKFKPIEQSFKDLNNRIDTYKQS
ncbi:MAG: type II toxin-antitoxin system Phd/YefM family antitoxin [Nitrosopumilus sp.]